MGDFDQDILNKLFRPEKYANIDAVNKPSEIFPKLEEPFWNLKCTEPEKSSKLTFPKFCEMSLEHLEFKNGKGVKARQDFSKHFSNYEENLRSKSVMAFILNGAEKILLTKKGRGNQFGIPLFELLRGETTAVRLKEEIQKATGLHIYGAIPCTSKVDYKLKKTIVYEFRLVKGKNPNGKDDTKVKGSLPDMTSGAWKWSSLTNRENILPADDTLMSRFHHYLKSKADAILGCNYY